MGVMRSALTWVCLGLLANTATATLSQEAIDELEEELKNAADATGDYGLFVDPAENELFDLLQNDGQGDDDAAFEPPAQDEDPPARYPGDSSEVIESIDEIESITPIKSIQEVKSIKKVKSILPVPDDIAQKFIADHGLVPTDDDGYNTAPQYVDLGVDTSEEPVQEMAQNSLKAGLEDAIGILNSLVQALEDQDLCREGENEPDPGPTWSYKPNKETNLPFDIDDIESIDKIKSMKEITSMLPVKKITEVKSITPIKSI